MLHQTLTFLLVVVGSVSVVSGQTSGEAVSRSHGFMLPFSLPDKDEAGNPFAVTRLFVSRDRGKTWSVAATAAGNVKQIPVLANDDGHYWFSVRRLTPQGESFPPESVKPEMHVLVDTTPPKLKVDTVRESPGQIRVSVEAEDVALLPASLELRYLSSDPLSKWESIPVEPRSLSIEEGRLRTTVQVKITTPFDLKFRGSIWDKVGHKTVAESHMSQKPRAIPRGDLTEDGLPKAAASLPRVRPMTINSDTGNVLGKPIPANQFPLNMAEPTKNSWTTVAAGSATVVVPAPLTSTQTFPEAKLLPVGNEKEAAQVSSVTEADLTLFEKLVTRQPSNIRLREAYAEALQQRKDFYRAELQWRKVLSLSPNHATASTHLAECLKGQNRTAEAARVTD